jgi:hypothetical protein
VPVKFYLTSQVVGEFALADAPLQEGEHAYMPYRGPGHVNLMNQLKAGQVPRCHYVHEGRRIEFSVVAHIAYGMLRLNGFDKLGG